MRPMPNPPSGNKNKRNGYSKRVCVARSKDHKKSATAEPTTIPSAVVMVNHFAM